jgi:alkylation response protein AidB-like acyl-CoA dehydrogenase
VTIGLTDQHRALRDAVRGWAGRAVPPEAVRAAVDAKQEQRPPYWNSLAEQGLLGLHLPEEHGGSGQTLLEQAVAVEELARALVPGPVLPTVLASAVLHAANHTAHLGRLASGEAIGALALEPGSLVLDGDVLTGESAPVPGAVVADVLVLRAGDRWVVAAASAVEVVELSSYDLTCRLGRVRADRVRVEVLDVDSTTVPSIAAVLFAAEACGVADRCTTTAAEYAKVRQQFGRPIGQFQGVKHRCARMLARTEQARAAAWDAARSAHERTDEARLAAAVAAAIAPEAAFRNAKDCIQVLGGIGFTWEHDASLYLRRAHSLRLLLGSTAHWQQDVARLALAGVRRTLGVDLPPEAARIRAGIRAELEAAPADTDGQRRFLAEHGYAAPHLPAPWGKGADAVTQLVIAEELRAANLRAAELVIAGWVVPTLITDGSEEQQRRLLPKTLAGDLVWCQLFSEPGAGSDLAALKTRATKVDAGWRITGQKVWTSRAKEAHYGICLARTDPQAPKHHGLSYFLVDMSAPGIEIRPLRELTGEALFNEVFLDDVFVPDDGLVGAPGDGWRLARNTLANERVALSYGSSLGPAGEALLDIARRVDLDAAQRAVLGGLLADAQAGGLLGLRATLRSLAGGQPGPESSLGKLLGAENVQHLYQAAMEWQGSESLTQDTADRTTAARGFLAARCTTIAGGTTEVQLNINGERLLGLPRDPDPR